MTPRGLRNNNPLNIRHNADVFQGEIKGNDKSFKTFEKIITRFAPPSENDTRAYIAAVVKYSGVASDEALTATSGDKYILIVSAMSFVENGVNTDISQIKAGFNLQSKITMQ